MTERAKQIRIRLHRNKQLYNKWPTMFTGETSAFRDEKKKLEAELASLMEKKPK